MSAPATPNLRALRQSAGRLLTFLTAIREVPSIRARFAKLGWSRRDEEVAWELLRAVAGPSDQAPVALGNAVTEAIARCEAAKDTHLVVAKGALGLEHPEYVSVVFQNTMPGKDYAAVLQVLMFLERIDLLERSPDRKATREADHEVLACLARRGITKAVLADLREAVHAAQYTDLPAPPDDTAHREALGKIHAWLDAWAEMARTVVTRRDELIRLGLVKRRSPRPTPAVALAAPQVVTPIVAAAASTGPSTADEEEPASGERVLVRVLATGR